MKTRHIILPLFVASVALAAPPMLARAQSSPDSGNLSGTVEIPANPEPTYIRPTEKTKFRNYSFDALGPYPIVIGLFNAGIDQEGNAPPEWKQGSEGYSKRFGSDFAIEAVSTTTRYALSEALREDALYYRCRCSGLFPRLSHAVISTLTARRGEDGHSVFSVPALVAPYAGSMTAVYAWYPSRYGAEDALRMGSYTMLGYVGANIGLEFLYSGPHSLRSRMHLNNAQGAPDSAPTP